MKVSAKNVSPRREWVSITGHEGIPEYNAISDPHCPVARTPAVLKLCEQHAAPMPNRTAKKNDSPAAHAHMCSRKKRAMDFIAKQKHRHESETASGSAAGERKPKKRMIRRWTLADEPSSSEDDMDVAADADDTAKQKKKPAVHRPNKGIEDALENWATIRDDINGCWAFYGMNAVFIDKKREEERRLYEGVQRLYDKEDEQRQDEAAARDRLMKRERLAKVAKERHEREEGAVEPGSTVSSRQRAVQKPSTPRGSSGTAGGKQPEPKVPTAQPPSRANPRNLVGHQHSSEPVTPSAAPIPKPPPRRPFQSFPALSPSEASDSAPTSPSTATETAYGSSQQKPPSPPQQAPAVAASVPTVAKHDHKGEVVPLEDGSPQRTQSLPSTTIDNSDNSQPKTSAAAAAPATQHLQDLMGGTAQEEEEEL